MGQLRAISSAALAALLVACGGGGGNMGPPSGGGDDDGLPPPSSAPALKTNLAARYGVVDFPVGAAIEPLSLTNGDREVLLKHYSSITAENVMKPAALWPNMPGTSGATALPATQPDFTEADKLRDFANSNGIQLRGHTLLWHQSAPDWFFAFGGVDPNTDPVNYRILLQQRLRSYIFAVVQHFPNVYAWDVVNEVATDAPNPVTPYRTNSPWYQAYSVGGLDGSDYVRDAFMIADDARQSIGRNSDTMKLMLNDYSTESSSKRANVIAIVQDLINAGVPIDGVGHQFHLQLGADVSQVTAAFTAVEALGTTLVNHVTELDVSIYQDPANCFTAPAIPPCMADYGASPPATALSQQATLYRALFTAFDRNSVTSISTWGIADNHTWLNSWPVTRTNRPLLFDVSRNPKAAFWAVVDPAFVIR